MVKKEKKTEPGSSLHKTVGIGEGGASFSGEVTGVGDGDPPAVRQQ